MSLGTGRTAPLELALERALLEIHQLERTVMHYKESNQVLLFDRINNVAKELRHVQKSAEHLDIEIPGEVVSLLDEGRNPDLYTRDFLERCMTANEATKGRVDAFKELRGHLLDNLDDIFPAETEAYQAIKSAAAEKLEKERARESERASDANEGHMPVEAATTKREASDHLVLQDHGVDSNNLESDAQQRRVKPKLEPPG